MTLNPKELVQALNEKRAEIKELKLKLDEVHKEKEQWFATRQDFSNQIRTNIQKIKDLKQKRDAFTAEVKDLKQKRDTTHKELQKVAPAVKDQQQKPIQTQPSSFNPNRKPLPIIKKEMDKIELMIETGAISFTKEKELMKKLKQLKKEYQQGVLDRQAHQQKRELSHKVHEMGREAETFHHLVMHKASESQKMHNEILTIAKHVDDLKVKEKEAHEKFIELKAKFNELNNQLKSQLGEIGKTRSQLDEHDKEKTKQHQQKRRSSLEDMKRAVEEKFKSGQKLTIDDIKIMQMAGKD